MIWLQYACLSKHFYSSSLTLEYLNADQETANTFLTSDVYSKKNKHSLNHFTWMRCSQLVGPTLSGAISYKHTHTHTKSASLAWLTSSPPSPFGRTLDVLGLWNGLFEFWVIQSFALALCWAFLSSLVLSFSLSSLHLSASSSDCPDPMSRCLTPSNV